MPKGYPGDDEECLLITGCDISRLRLTCYSDAKVKRACGGSGILDGVSIPTVEAGKGDDLL